VLITDFIKIAHVFKVPAATGAWYSLDQKNIDAVLEKQQKNPIDPKDLEKFLY